MKETITLSIRTAGLVLIIYTLAKTPVHTMAYSIRPEYGILSYLLPFSIPIIAGILLFLFPNTIGNNLSKASPEILSVENPKRLVQIGCIVLGLVFLFFSISDAVVHVTIALMLWLSDKHELGMLTFDIPGAVATVIEIIFSLFLIFKSKILAAKINFE
ncbi:MAG: hypothetical protein OEZ39_19895 [Gammaproteobacteria bacterium]|nr:hypothetical protein [Gammaproteobacteria bacterium]MDH5654131.1 hypothetical protein [Gammaproteobacteria bacterium]